MKAIVLLLLVASICGLNPTLNTALRNQVIIDFKDNLIPIISKQIQTIRVPDIHASGGGAKIDITEIVVHVDPIRSPQVNIVLKPASSIVLSGNSFSMNGGAKIHLKWLFISKTVSARMEVRGAGFDTTIEIRSLNNKPNVAITAFHIHLSAGNVSIHISGGLIGAIINLIVGLMKKHLVENIVSNIQKSLPNIITSKVNSILNNLNTDISITPLISLKYSFPTPPIVKDGHLFVGIVGYLHPKSDPNPPSGQPKPMPQFEPGLSKNIQFFISDFIVTSALNTAQKLNLMYIEIKQTIANHPVNMICRTTKTPEFNFNKAISVVGFGSCDVVFDNNQNNKFTLIAEISLVLTEKIKAAIVFFSAEKLEFTKIEYKSDHPVDIEWFKSAINDVIKVVLMVLNGELGTKGIPLPKIKEIDYSDMVQSIGVGYTTVGTNPIFHFTTQPTDVPLFEGDPGSVELDISYLDDFSEQDFN